MKNRVLNINKTNNTIDDIVRECADNINDENATAEIIENALKTLNKEDATLLCNKLGLLFEKLQQLSRAEDFFKRAFGYTQSLEYLEFCKRQRKFKKAARLLKFKLDNAPEDEKTAVLNMVNATYEMLKIRNAKIPGVKG